MSSDSISPSNLPPLSASARLSASTSKARGSRPLAISFGRSTTSPTPTMTGMRSSGTGDFGIFSCFTFGCQFDASFYFPSLRAKRSNPSRRKKSMDCFVRCAPRNDGSFRHQRVHVLHRLDEILLEFLHHGARGFHAVDQADALADEVADEVARLRIA